MDNRWHRERGTLAIPASVGSLVLGSSISGTDPANGAFDEFFSFNRALTAGDAAFYYQFTGRRRLWDRFQPARRL